MQIFNSPARIEDLSIEVLETLNSMAEIWGCKIEDINKDAGLIMINGEEEADCIMAIKQYLQGYSDKIITISTVI